MLHVFFRVRAKLRNGARGYQFASSMFLRCLYEDEDGDSYNPEEGFLKGPLLLRVSFLLLCRTALLLTMTYVQAYRHIFTSPSSACDENMPSETTSRRRDVASQLRLGGHVTGRSIAYAATQVRRTPLISLAFLPSFIFPKLVFSLSSARDWKKHHAGFHFTTFYNFIVDMFEDPEDEPARKSATELLQWWNRYVYVQHESHIVLITSLLFRKIFPVITNRTTVAESENVMLECQRRLREARARRALRNPGPTPPVQSTAPPVQSTPPVQSPSPAALRDPTPSPSTQ